MPALRILSLAAAALCLAFTAAAQAGSGSLAAYETCRFSDGLQIVQTDSLAPGKTSREVETDDGPRQIEIEAGLRIMFAYPGTDFYANVKAERLPSARFSELKGYLLANLGHLGRGNRVNTAIQSPMNGFEVHGIDREKLEGSVLGMYLLLSDSDHTVTTIYLLNQEPQGRKFQSMEEYRGLRDRFLAAYTSCIHHNLTRTQ
jgi:hypothetical protein